MSDPHVRPFPLVPQRRFAGVRFGERRSPRRGPGDEVAGTRTYRPGDRRAWIDWRASARLSAARARDEFVVREFFADQAPRVVVVVDHRPRMGLYPAPFPWLDKPAAVDAAVRLIAASTARERGDLTLVDHRGGRPLWLAPRSPFEALTLFERRQRPPAFAGGSRFLEECLELLARHSPVLPSGTFVFILSDFVDAVRPRAWARLRSLCWDVTPVLVQDPTWEQSFPDVGGVLLPVLDPESGVAGDVLISRSEARVRAFANERRRDVLLTGFVRLGFDPIVLGTSDPAEIATSFGHWADRRLRLRRRTA